MASEENDDYFLPLVDQRVFGAGIKRKRVAFVSASEEDAQLSQKSTANIPAGDRYLSLVLKQKTDADSSLTGSDNPSPAVPDTESTPSICIVCDQPLSLDCGERDGHDSSIAHQICLAHSHPPSHLDRRRTGLKYLQGYGWDPDARKGLGARQEGILAPVKTKQKNDTVGIGIEEIYEDVDTNSKRMRKSQNIQQDVVKLNAKAVREMETEKSKRAERLRQSFYGKDLSAYLSSNG